MTHASLIDNWPSLSEFAADIGIKYGTAKAMRRRGAIPANRWAAVVSAAEERGYEQVTFEKLAEIAADRQEDA
ncbi:hypothetical protein [Maritalea myrionectae]|nr:hypothetical protein [Maritalea myrionectae]